MSKRTEMLATEVRAIITQALKACPRECGIASITRLEISNDASYATAYVSALLKPEVALDYLQKERHELQRQLGRMPRKKIPLLRFRLDEGPKHGSRIDELLSGEASKMAPEGE